MDFRYASYHLPTHMQDLRRKLGVRGPNSMVYLVMVILILGVILTLLNIYELHKMKEDHSVIHSNLAMPFVEGKEGKLVYKHPILWVYGKKLETGYLKHVFNVFERIGYVTGDAESDWEVLWAHDYPFVTLSKHLTSLKPHQKINHFPGSGFITNKASLASTKMKFIPTAFKIPKDKENLMAYSKQNPNTQWVQKSNNHRGIEIKKLPDLDLTKEGTFIQEYVSKPFLVDGRKFDIGVYVILTSINPLRLYMVEGDALFRFCSEDYYPFDDRVIEKYVVKDDYTPMWKLPSMKNIYEDMNYSFIDTFNYFLEQRGKDYKKIWADIRSAILTVYLDKEPRLIESSWKYKTTRNFFEMVRFDFVLDEDLNVYLMEANMSPNLSSAHFAANKRLYEHVIFNLLNLVGLAKSVSNDIFKSSDDEVEMQVSDKDIQVYAEICGSDRCADRCSHQECKLCNKCLTTEMRITLKMAYLEHVRRGSCRRVFPQPITPSNALNWDDIRGTSSFKSLSEQNQLISIWFMVKCRQDSAWCR